MGAYLQMGHDTENLVGESDLEEFVGVVLSPVNRGSDKLHENMLLFREKGEFDIILDPQLYYPKGRREKLVDQPYFPDAFDTKDFSTLAGWDDIVKELAVFVKKLGVDTVASPVSMPRRWGDEFYDTCVETSKQLSKAVGGDSRVLTTCLVSLNDLDDGARAKQIGSILTRHDTQGFYVVLHSEIDPRRELSDADGLATLMNLISLLVRQAPVMVAYASSDMVLFKAAGATHCGTSKFFNLRRFTLSRFDEPPAGGGGQLPYWFEHNLMAFLREADIKRIEKAEHGHLIGGLNSGSASGKQILDFFKSNPGEAWLGKSWRQYLSWFGKTEGDAEAGGAALVQEWLKSAEHMLAHLICNQRHTVTGLLSALGRGQQDWSRAYRLYREHVDSEAVFSPILDGVLELIPAAMPLVVGVDDSHLRKTGKHLAGTGWYRDPLGPAFHTNLMYAQRFIQLSAAVPDPHNPKRSRMIPIAIKLIPKLPKPAKDAPKQDWDHYEQLKAFNSPGAHARLLLQQVRHHLDAYKEQKNRRIWVCGDGDYSNSTLLPALPPRTVYIGRTRTDINLRAVPKLSKRRAVGRPRAYGKKLPTPQELRKDKTRPWQHTQICNGPKTTKVRYKHLPKAKWHVAGETTIVQIVVIAPLRYTKRKNAPWSYTKPAYLVCTDAGLPVDELIQAYFWRWGIEVNFKEEKQLFGAGQAQVRGSTSVSCAPAVCMATYAALLLAGLRAYGFDSRPPSLNPPRWYRRKQHSRVTCSDLIHQFHQELMLEATGNFSPLTFHLPPNMTSLKSMIGRAA